MFLVLYGDNNAAVIKDQVMANHSLDKEKIKILLLEGVHPGTVESFKSAGYSNIDYLKTSLAEEELK